MTSPHLLLYTLHVTLHTLYLRIIMPDLPATKNQTNYVQALCIQT